MREAHYRLLDFSLFFFRAAFSACFLPYAAASWMIARGLLRFWSIISLQLASKLPATSVTAARQLLRASSALRTTGGGPRATDPRQPEKLTAAARTDRIAVLALKYVAAGGVRGTAAPRLPMA
jgi:hypothetical protein